MPVTPALWKTKDQEFKTIFSYIKVLRTTWAMRETVSTKQEKKKKQETEKEKSPHNKQSETTKNLNF